MKYIGRVWKFGDDVNTDEIIPARYLNSSDPKELASHVMEDADPEFPAKVIREWLHRLGVTTLFIELGSPWEYGYVESFNGKLRDELINREVFTTLLEAKTLIGDWRRQYNEVAPIAPSGTGLQPLRLSSQP